MLYASKLAENSWLVVMSRYGVPVFDHPNQFFSLTCNCLAVKYQRCTLGLPSCALVFVSLDVCLMTRIQWFCSFLF